MLSKKSTASALFVPLTGAIDSTHLREARPALQLVGITSAFQARIAYRYASTFASLAPTERKRFVRFGVASKNGTAGKPETGMVNLRVDARRS